MKWNVFSMSDLIQKGYEFSLLTIVLENYSHSTLWNKQKTPEGLGMGFLNNPFHFLQNAILHLYSFSCNVVCQVKAWAMISHIQNSLGMDSFTGTDVKSRKPFSRTSHILCHNVLAGIVSCVTILFTPSKQPIIMTISLTYQSKSYHPLCWFFMSSHTIGFTFSFGDLIFRNNMRKLFRNFSIPSLVCYLQSYSADLGPCYLTVAPSPFIIFIPIRWHFLCKIHPYERIQSHQEWCWQLSERFFPSK